MAQLPNPFAWQYNRNKRYLRLDGSGSGFLKFTDDNPNYVFKTEDADTSGYVRIKNTENNLYLIGVPSAPGENRKLFIKAISDKEADYEDSTLFELKKFEPTTDPGVILFRVRHVNSNSYLRPQNSEVLCAVEPGPDAGNADVFTAIGQTP